MTRDSTVSLWDSSALEEDYENPVVGDKNVDVAIVGGGFTGLSTALHCGERGLSAHVLEANHIGFGGSGRNVGLVNAGVWHPPAQVRKQLGDTYGPKFVERFGAAPERLSRDWEARPATLFSTVPSQTTVPMNSEGMRAGKSDLRQLNRIAVVLAALFQKCIRNNESVRHEPLSALYILPPDSPSGCRQHLIKIVGDCILQPNELGR